MKREIRNLRGNWNPYLVDDNYQSTIIKNKMRSKERADSGRRGGWSEGRGLVGLDSPSMPARGPGHASGDGRKNVTRLRLGSGGEAPEIRDVLFN